ncbi:helix-turn-helix domain-containing protein [Pedobacter sp. UYP1]|uniref:helix-turn-helix domain-containing protein n=1 Tax=Pedobacter sp. UYP1 TaxID=1756396 RepID=UPI00339AD1B4
MNSYSIRDIIRYRELDWQHSDDFFYLVDIPNQFESFVLKPNYFCCGIINKGGITIEVDGRIHKMGKQSFLIYKPDQIVRIIDISPDSQGAFILFTKRFISYIKEDISKESHPSFLSTQFTSYTVLSPFSYYRLASFFAKLFDLLTNINRETWEYSAKSLISVLFNEIDVNLRNSIYNIPNSGNIRETTLVNEFKALVNEHFLQERAVVFYADKISVSSGYLHRIVKKQLGITPGAFVNAFLFSEAKSLLSYSTYNISEIAEKLSFSDIYSFSKYFKKHSGMSPSQYRSLFLSN